MTLLQNTESARKILRHRKGTVFEDLYAINLDTGAIVAVTDSPYPQRVFASKGMESSIGKWRMKGQRFAMLHNHPDSLLPSPEDIRALAERGASFGIIAAHDGSVFKYSIVGEGSWPLEDISTMYYKRISSHAESDVLAMIEERTGVRIEHIA